MAQPAVDSSLRDRWESLRASAQTRSEVHAWSYTELGAVQYALSVGATAADLPFVYEGHRDGLRVLPTMAVLPTIGAWDWFAALLRIEDDRIILGEQSMRVDRDLPPALHAQYHHRLDGLSDKKSSAMAQVTTTIEADGAPVGRCVSRYFIRDAAGGFGAGPAEPDQPPLDADGEAPTERRWQVPPEASLLYRLSGDLHPIHVDARVAQSAGHPRPPLHGMYLLGRLCRDLICEHGRGVRSARIRYRGAAYPGDTTVNRWWMGSDAAQCHVQAVDRQALVCQTAFAAR